MRKLGSQSLRGHVARESSARSHFQVTWLKKARLEVTSRSLGSRISSKILRGHLARENSPRRHFQFEKTRLEVTPRSRKLQKVTSKSLQGHKPRKHYKGVRFPRNLDLESHLVPDNPARSRFEVTKTRLEVTPRSRELRLLSLRSRKT